ncbi:MAG: hypothetical protein P8011_08460 [Acidihalobacter sp.]|uniref:serine O-acetyltransferase EpsC n=1 Tax=Acidihalobacter sp. TaxID=1872108 RepID=UPI00307F2EC8
MMHSMLQDGGQELDRIRGEILATYLGDGATNHLDGKNLPSQAEVIDLINRILRLMFPGFYDGDDNIHRGNMKSWCGYLLDRVHQGLTKQVARSLCIGCIGGEMQKTIVRAERVSLDFLSNLPRVRRLLIKDIKAAYVGDPAAASIEEVILAYPSIQAIALYRLAHELYLRDVPLIPRLISEYAHMRFGIDIHPGAAIGESVFVDHGTGVVIGETCEIGNNVKIYQMVTLGALSFNKDAEGRLIKGRMIKRHPTIEDDVVLYAGCTILGGDTNIGQGSIIGGNVWVTNSVPANTVITFDAEKAEYRRFVRREWSFA